jgi:O-antigen/teichoic acid export membrane protein
MAPPVAPADTGPPGMIARAGAILRSPLILNGYSLVVSAGMTSALGLVWWMLAAQIHDAEEVGLNAALISTMMALGSIAQLNLGSILTRYLPTAGQAARRWILVSYAIGCTVAILCCTVFLLGVRVFAPSLGFLWADLWTAAWFVLATVIWTVFALQDLVLAGLRKAIWLPVENTLFAIAKIVLLLVLAASSLRGLGPFMAWTLSAAAAVVPVNLLLFGRILPGHARVPAAGPGRVQPRSVLRYFWGDSAGMLFFTIAIALPPMLILETAGPEHNAVYYLAWTITYSLYMVSKSMGISLVAEGAVDSGRLPKLAAATFLHTMSMLLVAVAVIILGSPLILGLFGADYALEGASLLRLLALSALPFGITSVFLGVARVEGRMRAVAVIQAILMLLVLGMGIPLLHLYGIVGMGLAWLAGQSLVAAALVLAALHQAGWSVRRAGLSWTALLGSLLVPGRAAANAPGMAP